jgi:acyl carrier protein
MRVLSWQAGFESIRDIIYKELYMADKDNTTVDEKLFAEIKSLIASKLEIDEGKINMDASFRQDLGADSLDTYELVYQIEETMGIKIPDDKVNEFETVRDAYNFIKANKK